MQFYKRVLGIAFALFIFLVFGINIHDVLIRFDPGTLRDIRIGNICPVPVHKHLFFTGDRIDLHDTCLVRQVAGVTTLEEAPQIALGFDAFALELSCFHIDLTKVVVALP